ncbi:MAG: T9SS type A sorting domain-containing protein [Chitinophagales bacterium]
MTTSKPIYTNFKYALTVISFLFLSYGYGQVTTFSKTIDTTGPGGIFTDTGKQLIELEDSSLVLYAFSRYRDTIFHSIDGASVTKIDKRGNKIWTEIIETLSPPYAILPASPNGIIPWHNNGFMITGSSGTDSTKGDFFLMELDEYGKELWFRHYDTFMTEMGSSGGIVPTSNNGIAFLGDRGIFNDLPSWNIYLVQMDSLGNVLWDRDIGGDDFDIGLSIAVDTDGGFILGGHSRSAPAHEDGNGIVVKTDSEGNVLWQQVYGTENGDGSCLVYPAKVREGYVAGCYLRTMVTFGDYPDVMLIYGLDEKGEILWEHPFNARPNFKAPNDFTVLDDGSIVVVGYDENVPQISDEENTFNIRESYGWMAKLDKDGNLLWERQYYDDKAITPLMYLWDVVPTLDGGLAATGTIWTRDTVYSEELDSTFYVLNRDIWVVKTDADGCMYPDCSDEVVYTDIEEIGEISILQMDKIPAFQLFPNPARQFTHLYFPNTQILKGKKAVLEVLDLQGRVVFERGFEQKLLNGKELSFLELEDLQGGTYLVVLKIEGKEVWTERLVVVR